MVHGEDEHAATAEILVKLRGSFDLQSSGNTSNNQGNNSCVDGGDDDIDQDESQETNYTENEKEYDGFYDGDYGDEDDEDLNDEPGSDHSPGHDSSDEEDSIGFADDIDKDNKTEKICWFDGVSEASFATQADDFAQDCDSAPDDDTVSTVSDFGKGNRIAFPEKASGKQTNKPKESPRLSNEDRHQLNQIGDDKKDEQTPSDSSNNVIDLTRDLGSSMALKGTGGARKSKLNLLTK